MISFRPFRELVEGRNISTYYLRNKCGDYNIDHKTIERLMADESVSTNTINSLCQIFKCDFYDFHTAFNSVQRLERMYFGKARKRCEFLVDFRIVFHRAGTKGIKTVVDSERSFCQFIIVPRNFVFIHFRQAGKASAFH